MEKVKPDLYRKFTPTEYENEFKRIDKEIKKMDDIGFEIILNTDIPFLCDFKRSWKRPLSHLKKQPINTQKQVYIRYLQNIFMFPSTMFQSN
ncbi:hypothetical protein [Elizabethkingia miricola]|uniref:hypothetical protein n=1 Tax=Elizabethkingia miricola TaxID=172045 RepID=UPI003891D3CA